MNKTQLVSTIASETGVAVKTVKTVLDTAFTKIEGDLKDGNKVSIAGFGILNVSERSAREGRNPKTGEKIQIPAKKTVRYKASKNIRDSINS